MRALYLAALLVACGRTDTPSTSPQWHAVEIQGETVPILPEGSVDTSALRVARLIIRRDLVSDQPEWLSGHRHALAFYLEQLPIETIVIESPWDDTTFYRAGAAWGELFQNWVLRDFLPFLRPYTRVRYVIFGRELRKAPVSAAYWRALLDFAKAQDTLRLWGLSAPHPDSLPATEAWDVLAIDYQHFYPLHERPAYHAAWEAVQKPLLLLYPNLYEPDTATALTERLKYWQRPPIATVRIR